LLHCIAKSESQLSYDALFISLRLVADRLRNPNIHICAVGMMDHCEAFQNAAQAGGTMGAVICVVDSILHNLIIHQNLLVARGAADEEEDDDEEEGEETKGHKKKKKKIPPIS
jgi:hypothetical protein